MAARGGRAHTARVTVARLSRRSLVTGGATVSLMIVVAGLRWPLVQLTMSSDDPILALLDGLVGLSLILTGCYLLTCRGQHSNGALLASSGALSLLISTRWAFEAATFIQWVLVPIPIVVVAIVLLRYPNSRSTDRPVQLFIWLFVGWLCAGRVVNALLWDPAWGGSFRIWWPTLLRSPRAYTAAAWAYHGGNVVLAVGFAVLVVHRLRRLTGLMRVRTWPLAVLGPAAALALGLSSAAWLLPLASDVMRDVAVSVDGVLLIIPAAFAVIALQQKFERTHVAEALMRMSGGATPVQIRDALRVAVAEPRLELAFHLNDSLDWVDAAGLPVAMDCLGRDHLLVPLDDSDGHPLAVVVTDPGLAAHRDVLDPAVTAVRLSLENLRLQAVALARLEEVKQSRRRLMLAGVEERRRVERDLHDGAQQRLLAVAASLSRARERATDSTSRGVLDAARDDLRAALRDLRELAAGLHPAVLSQSGLAAALGSVTERLPLSVRTDVEARRWPAEVEMAAYFVICESLTNVIKHSGAATATVTVSQHGGSLLLSVVDNGSGGAARAPGRGLAGLADRVAALGGTLSIDSAPGRGTRIEAGLPCV